ncbi:MBOAT family protein [Flavobacterium sp. W22_SRS_FK3]|uniref:MBOAT family O-acyltransferase n=1 Tax=Flavobacterium sp. W22_SRS_FK3 TaxID=3240275 RepID=UPI003F9264AD
MLFNTVGFAVFFSIIFLLYWFVFNKRLRDQNIFLLFVSFAFYSFWDWRFLFLLFFSIGLDFYIGNRIYLNSKNQSRKKIWLWLSILANLSFLGFFKYFNFFIDNFTDFLTLLGLKSNHWSLQIILPVGISFYTFHGLSYVIDIYKDKIKPEKSLIDYSLFVSFFPLLVAGPIERATHLLPQIKMKRNFNYENAVNGLRQILWGLVKKIVIADGCAVYVNMIYDNPSNYSGSTLVIGAILFSFQIYGDFSGYTDIALGVARLLGIELLQNFSYPYFSRDIAEFWRRWHISLSSWFRDYVYIPLGGSNGNKYEIIRNTFIIFILSGFWHGANWTFVIWGSLNAIFFLPLLLRNKNREHLKIVTGNDFNLKTIRQIFLTFGMVTFAWIFFRSNSINDALNYVSIIFSKTLFSLPEIFPKMIFAYLFLFICIEWRGRNNRFAIEYFGLSWRKQIRIVFYYLLSGMVLYYSGKEFQFLYFQF